MVKPNVLIADSDVAGRELLSLMLTGAGASVDVADSEESAFRRYLEVGHDLVVIDLLLPRQGGLSLLRRLRSLREGDTVPVLMVGAITQDKEFRKEALHQLGALDYVKKPFAPDAVRAKLLEALERSRDDPPPEEVVVNPFAFRDFPQKGSLGPYLSPQLLHHFAALRLTGCLTFQRRRQKKVVFLRSGAIHFALSNQLRETLSSHLLDRGLIGEDTVRAAVDTMRREGMKLGEYLIVNEILSAREVFAAIRENVRDKVLDVLRWSRGDFLVTDYRDPPAPLPGSSLTVPGLLWDSVHRDRSPEQLRGQLQSLGDLILAPREGEVPFEAETSLRGADLRLFRSVRAAGFVPLHRVLEDVEDERGVQILYYLLLRGQLVLSGGSPPQGETTPQPPTGGRLGGARQQLHRLRRRNHFQVLGVGLSADDVAVREAYRSRAKSVHPDTLAPDDPPELTRVYAETFQRIRDAYEGLKDHSRREDYLRYLEGGERAEPAAEGCAAMQAEVHYQEAQRFLKKRDWRAAEELLQKAVDLVPGEGEYVLRLAVSRLHLAGADRPDLLREAEEGLYRAKAIQTASPEPCYYLGRLTLQRGDPDSADQHFRTALTRDPSHLPSQRELRLLRARGGTRRGGRRRSGLFGKE